jgi:amino acid adenylation domain-containing protein
MVYLLSQIIDNAAQKFPERPAFRFHGDTANYANLSTWTSQLANVLIEQGVKRRDRVGIFMNKCLEMPIAVHGIMKAGAAYVPIDPAAPAERLKFIISDCNISVLIADKAKARVLETIAGQTCLNCLIGTVTDAGLPYSNISWDEIRSAPAHHPLQHPVMEDDLAYIMYTSGSTGQPKGIMHTHRSGLSYAKLSAQTYGLHEGDRLGNHSPLHFDMSTLEFLTGPSQGACTVLIPEEYAKLPASLSKLIEDERLTVWYSVPFALCQLLLRGAMESKSLESLRWVLFGGEPFPPKYLRALMEVLPKARFCNVYGPAEVNQCTYYHLTEPPDNDLESVPIGKVWPNCEGLVVDDEDQPVSFGNQGELLIRTPTMMRGYWNRDDLNAKAFFIREPFSNYSEIFYRTGDLVRQNDDGDYVYLGRKDRQIKTRGYRVELDEIEAALSRHQEVEEAAAFSLPDDEGTAMVAAAVILKNDNIIEPSELIKFLKSLLPAYALPGFIKIYRVFPRTSSGKIDRLKLRELETDSSAN